MVGCGISSKLLGSFSPQGLARLSNYRQLSPCGIHDDNICSSFGMFEVYNILYNFIRNYGTVILVILEVPTVHKGVIPPLSAQEFFDEELWEEKAAMLP